MTDLDPQEIQNKAAELLNSINKIDVDTDVWSCKRRSKSVAPGGAKVSRRDDCIAGWGLGPASEVLLG